MDTVLGVSVASSTVQMVLVEGENADGATVDRDGFDIGGQDQTVPAGSERVIRAILGTQESAAENGCRLLSTGVAWSGDEAVAASLRDALARHKMENVMLVSAFLAAAVLARTAGAGSGYAYAALLFVEPDAATLAVVSTADGSIAEVQRRQVHPVGAVAALSEEVSALPELDTHPGGVFVVGSGVDVTLIAQQLGSATPLPVSSPEEPELALARGAALASAHAPLFASSTSAVAYAQDPGTGMVPPVAAPEYAAFNTSDGIPGLAYSAVPATGTLPATAAPPATGTLAAADSARLDFSTGDGRQQQIRSLGWAGGAVAIFIAGVVALVVALAFGIRPHTERQPDTGGNVVAPSKQAPPPPPQAPSGKPAAPATPAAPAPAPEPERPPPARAPAPAPAPPPPPAIPIPVPVPIPGPDIPHGPPHLPGLPGIPGIPGL
ncbi:MAG TPA: hypothetical protein VFR17_12005 [Mycobacterium sp.]|nr:hypothetical protein [Mycobacterium sp.]